MENLILSCFLHSLPALSKQAQTSSGSPLSPYFLPPLFVILNAKKTRHVAGNGHTDGQRKSLLVETSHLLWSLLIWEKSRSRTIFIFVMQARQQKNLECRDGETYGKAGYSGSLVGWWASRMEWAFKIIRNYNTSSMPHDTIWKKAFGVQKKGKQLSIQSTIHS